MTFKTKLVVFCIVAIFIPVLLAAGLYMDAISDSIINQSTQEVQAGLLQSATNISYGFQLCEDLSDSLYLNVALQKALTEKGKKGDSGAAYTDVIYPAVRQNVSLHSAIIESITIYIENQDFIPNGNEVVFADNSIRKQNWYTHLSETTVKGKKMWQTNVEVIQNKPFQWTVNFYRKLDNYAGKFSGILCIRLREDYVKSNFSALGMSKVVCLLNDTGTIISSTDRLLVGEKAINQEVFLPLNSDMNHYTVHTQDTDYEVHTRFLSDNGDLYGKWRVVSVISQKVLLNKFHDSVQIALVIGIGGGFLIILAIIVFSNSITRRIKLLADKTQLVKNGDYHTVVDIGGKDEIGSLGNDFDNMIHHLNRLINEVHENEKKMNEYRLRQKETELIALHNQLNPHFLYNTLDAIRMHAILADNFETADMLVALSQMMRYSIMFGEDTVSLSDEINHTNNYFDLLRLKYDRFLELRTMIPDYLLESEILKMTIQPLVENAVKHAFVDDNTQGCITIEVSCVESSLYIIVKDNGCGIKPETVVRLNKRLCLTDVGKKDDDNGIGLRNVNSRIKLFYGIQYGLSVESTLGQGTNIHISMPNTKRKIMSNKILVE